MSGSNGVKENRAQERRPESLTVGNILAWLSLSHARARGPAADLDDAIMIVSVMTCIQIMCLGMIVTAGAIDSGFVGYPRRPTLLPLVNVVGFYPVTTDG